MKREPVKTARVFTLALLTLIVIPLLVIVLYAPYALIRRGHGVGLLDIAENLSWLAVGTLVTGALASAWRVALGYGHDRGVALRWSVMYLGASMVFTGGRAALALPGWGQELVGGVSLALLVLGAYLTLRRGDKRRVDRRVAN